MTATATSPQPKKPSAKKPISRAIAVQRKDAAEKRIAKLEVKLSKDKELLARYEELIATAAVEPPATTVLAESV